jgi:hypothetical protein
LPLLDNGQRLYLRGVLLNKFSCARFSRNVFAAEVSDVVVTRIHQRKRPKRLMK